MNKYWYNYKIAQKEENPFLVFIACLSIFVFAYLITIIIL